MITEKKFTEITHTDVRNGKELSLKTGKLAPHCDGSVVVTYGETQLLVTAVMNKNPDPNKDFMPLSVEFRESRYAAGKIGWWRFNKREWRPGDEVVLYARLIDRALRPMFPKWMVNDVIVTITPLALDMEHSPGELGIIGWSVALMLAGIPFHGPVGAARVGYAQEQFLINPTDSAVEDTLLDLHLAGATWTINMIESGGDECPMNILKQAFVYGQELIDRVCAIQNAFVTKVWVRQQQEILINYPTQEQFDHMEQVLSLETIATLQNLDKTEFDRRYAELESQLIDHFEALVNDETTDWKLSTLKIGFFNLVKKYIRKTILTKQQRIDSRGVDDIRTIFCEVGWVPRAHGCGLFWRGDSQVLSMLTLWSPGDAQLLDDMETTEEEKHFMHHYKMPPFSNNEAMMIRGTNRREIGHGRLAEKALEPMIPSKEDFPYVIRIVSEVLGSGGSTSMASVCGSTLALMDAGVPMRRPVSGIAMWLITGDGEQIVLTDIAGTEDFIGDMDFKLAGTSVWMTAIQMDIKVQGITVEKIYEIIDRANKGREDILQFMLQTIASPRPSLSPHAPLLMKFAVKPEQVREVIGPGGSVIQEIIRQTGVKIDLEDDGSGIITAKTQEAGQRALQMIKDVVWTPGVWDVVQGKISRVEAYGVFVDLGKKKSGLCHVSKLGEWRLDNPASLFKVGQMISVKISGFDGDKIQLERVKSA